MWSLQITGTPLSRSVYKIEPHIIFDMAYILINSCICSVLADGEILRVLVNNSAQIKCDVGSSLPDDKVLLVVWYKNNLPIYR